MNIYALEGHKVRFDNPTSGYEYDQKQAAKYLQIGKEYTIDYTNVENSSTDVYLKEFPNISFNSVMFEDVAEQSDKDSSRHPDWRRYNE